MRGCRPADTLTLAPPRRDLARAPYVALDVAMATVGTQRGQRATDHPQTRHLAANTVTNQRINSLQQKTARPTVHRHPTMPMRRHLAAQRVQSVHSVPVHSHTRRSRASHGHARRPAPDAEPPTPCPSSIRLTLASPVSYAPELNPRPPRPNRLATDSHHYTTGLSVQHRPKTPPTEPNRIHSRPPWSALTAAI
jgi:hypothetical protein